MFGAKDADNSILQAPIIQHLDLDLDLGLLKH